jgi:signal transduction histidine kinase
MSAVPARATRAPSKAELTRARRARRLRARYPSTFLAVGATSARGPSAAVSVEAQQHLLACAAHELRGELTLQRTLAEVALADRDASAAALREMGKRIVVACEHQDRLLGALLDIARSGCGRRPLEPVDLAATAAEVLRAHDHRGLRRSAALELARTRGDPLLVERLVANLIANAVRHNIAGGRLDVGTYTAAGRAIFTVANTGPPIPATELTRLFQPFQRGSSPAGRSADGLGLGLTVVQAIANAHGATVTARAGTGGGLRIDVAFPALD